MILKESHVLNAILLTEATYAINGIVFSEGLSDEAKEQQLHDLLDDPDKMVLDANHLLEGSDNTEARKIFDQLFGTFEEPKDVLKKHYDILASWDTRTLSVAKRLALSGIVLETLALREQAQMFLNVLIETFTGKLLKEEQAK